MAKFKIKTKKAAAKRYRVTGSGKVQRRKSGNRHLMAHERSKTKRSRQGHVVVSGSDLAKIKKMLPGIGA